MRRNRQSGWPLVLTLLLVVSGGHAPARGEAVDPVARAQELAKRKVCMSNMKRIGNSCHIYANEHFDRFPPDLQTLLDRGRQVSEATLRCPSAGHDRIAYVYVAGQKATSDRRNVVVYEHRDNHAGEGINVVFVDSRAEWMSLAAFETALAATKNRLNQR